MIIDIKSRQSLDKLVVGNKAYQLNNIYQLGFTICSGCVLTADFFDTFCKENKINKNDCSFSEKIKQGIFSADLCSRLKSIYQEVSKKTGLIIVRSSALHEDGSDKSFAGVYESISNISNFTEMLTAIKQVWCSYYNEAVLDYHNRGFRTSMPILIQEMIICDKAGVLFTRNPVTYKREYVLEACFGGNEKIIQNESKAERYIFTKSNIPKIQKGLLSQKELKKFIRIASILEENLKFPCDLEWGIRKKELYLFQARPIIRKGDKEVYNRPNGIFDCILLDRYASAASVCYLSLLDRWQSQVYLSYYHKKRGLQAEEYPLCFLNNRVYWNTKYQKKYFEDEGSKNLIKKIKFHHLVNCGYKNWYKRLPVYDKKIAVYQKKINLTEEYGDLKKLLETVIHNFSCFIGIDHYRFLGIAQILYKRLHKKLNNSNINEQDILKIIGIKTNQSKTVAVNHQLLQLAAEITEDNCIKVLFLEKNEKDILDELETSEKYVKFKKELDEFLRNHGHRGIDCDDLYHPHWIENPQSILLLLKQYIKNGVPKTEKEKYPRTKIPDRKLRSLIRLNGEYMCLRENQRYYFDKSWLLIRQILLKLSNYYIDKQVIQEKQDIFHMTIEEVMDGLTYPEYLISKEVICNRKQIYHESMEMIPPYMIKDSEILSVQKDTIHKSYKVLGVSSGKSHGKIKIINDIYDLGQVRKGDIGVVRTFHPSWTPVLKVVSGLIMNYGNMLSHGAVVAREYGIPVVVFNAEAKKVFKDGDYVEIDAGKGRIHVLEKGGERNGQD
jgi:pyruvate,water dikinase